MIVGHSYYNKCYNLQGLVISINFSCGIEIVLLTESTKIPKQVTEVAGTTSFLWLISRPRSCKRFSKNFVFQRKTSIYKVVYIIKQPCMTM